MIYMISVFYLFYFAIVGVYIIFMPKVLEQLGYTGSEIGIIFAAAPLVRFLVPLMFIRGFRLGNASFYIALVILFVSVSTFYFSIHHFYALLFSNILFGVGLSLVLPYIELLSLSEIGKERYGKSRLFGSIGFMAVALVLVKFPGDPLTALDYLAVLTYITVLFAYLVVKNAHSLKQTTQYIANDVDLLRDWKLWAGFAMMQVSFGAFYNFFTIYETAHGISIDTTIYLWSFGVLIEIVMLYYQGALLRKNLLLVLQFATAATVLRWFLVFAFADNLGVLFFSQSLHALSFALFHSAAISYLYHLYKNRVLAQQLFSGVSYGLGGLFGALVAGYVYEYFPSYLFLSSTLLALVTLVLLHLYSKELRSV